MTQSPMPGLPAAQAVQSLAGHGSPTVMIVDDEPTTIEVLEVLLAVEGYTDVLTTTQPDRVLELLTARRPDVVLLNLLMPGIGGLEILAAMQRDPGLSSTPVIILTSSSDPDCKRAALEFGAHDFLAKPVDPSELSLRLRNTLALRGLNGSPEGERRAGLAATCLPSSASTPAERAPGPGPAVVSRLAGVSPRLAAIAQRFAVRLDGKLAEMDAALRAGDFDALAELAHWLRGAAGTVGFDDFTNPADELRTRARQRSAEQVRASIREIRELAARIERRDACA